jgi:hypothetical protein
VIGHLKDDHRMRSNHLKGRDGDRINAVLRAPAVHRCGEDSYAYLCKNYAWFCIDLHNIKRLPI